MVITLTREDGLQATFHAGWLMLERDGETRVETWKSEETLAERLLALGFKPENVSMGQLSR